MTNTEVLKEYFIWEEKNLTEPQLNCENKSVSEIKDTMNDTKINSTQNDWKNITDPKLRKKMRIQAWRINNKERMRLCKKAYYESNKENIKKGFNRWYQVNKEIVKHKSKSRYESKKSYIKMQQKAWRVVNKDKLKVKNDDYYKVNKYNINLQNKDYRKANRDKLNKYARKRHEMIKNNIQYKLSKVLRSRLHKSLNKNYKSGSAVRDLGCTISELKTYLESKFQPGMTWDNHGQYGWHVDHIKPLSSFDLSDRNQFLEACHYTNLQPLWAQDNLIKGSKIL